MGPKKGTSILGLRFAFKYIKVEQGTRKHILKVEQGNIFAFSLLHVNNETIKLTIVQFAFKAIEINNVINKGNVFLCVPLIGCVI